MITDTVIFIYFYCFRTDMAKPITATPTLRGEDARRFVRNMIKEETDPDPVRAATIKRALQTRFNFVD